MNGVERTGLWEEGKRVAWLDDDEYGEQMEEVNRVKEEAEKAENMRINR